MSKMLCKVVDDKYLARSFGKNEVAKSDLPWMVNVFEKQTSFLVFVVCMGQDIFDNS